LSIFDRIVSLVGRSNATILEIGANDGHDTAKLLKCFPYGIIFAFEPDPRAIEKFKSRITSERVFLTQKAVGLQSGRATFWQSSGSPEGSEQHWPAGWDMSGSIKKPTGHLEAHPWCKFETRIDVDMVTLDEWSRQNSIRLVDFVWADVQGAEEDLIKGGIETLSNTRFVYTEYSNVELYENEINLDQIMTLLPFFEIVENFGTDVLLRNKTLVAP
jgi:2-O-methyltransferase